MLNEKRIINDRVAQQVEHWTENPGRVSSILTPVTNKNLF